MKELTLALYTYDELSPKARIAADRAISHSTHPHEECEHMLAEMLKKTFPLSSLSVKTNSLDSANISGTIDPHEWLKLALPTDVYLFVEKNADVLPPLILTSDASRPSRSHKEYDMSPYIMALRLDEATECLSRHGGRYCDAQNGNILARTYRSVIMALGALEKTLLLKERKFYRSHKKKAKLDYLTLSDNAVFFETGQPVPPEVLNVITERKGETWIDR